jgi:hypothetical protein
MTKTWVITYLQHYYAGHKPHHNEILPSPASVDSSNAIHINEYSNKGIKSNRISGPRITYIPVEVQAEWPGKCAKKMWMRWWNFRFHKRWGISWLAENQVASQEELYSMEYVLRNIRARSGMVYRQNSFPSNVAGFRNTRGAFGTSLLIRWRCDILSPYEMCTECTCHNTNWNSIWIHMQECLQCNVNQFQYYQQ